MRGRVCVCVWIAIQISCTRNALISLQLFALAVGTCCVAAVTSRTSSSLSMVEQIQKEKLCPSTSRFVMAWGDKLLQCRSYIILEDGRLLLLSFNILNKLIICQPFTNEKIDSNRIVNYPTQPKKPCPFRWNQYRISQHANRPWRWEKGFAPRAGIRPSTTH